MVERNKVATFLQADWGKRSLHRFLDGVVIQFVSSSCVQNLACRIENTEVRKANTDA